MCVFAFVLLSAKQIAPVGIIKMTLTLTILKWTAHLLRTHKPQEIQLKTATLLTAVVLSHITFCH